MKSKMLQMVRDSTKKNVQDVKLEGGVWKALIDGVWQDVSELLRARGAMRNIEIKTDRLPPR